MAGIVNGEESINKTWADTLLQARIAEAEAAGEPHDCTPCTECGRWVKLIGLCDVCAMGARNAVLRAENLAAWAEIAKDIERREKKSASKQSVDCVNARRKRKVQRS